MVTKITDDGIEIREKKGDVIMFTFFPAHDALASGKIQKEACDTFAYRLQDVKVNDVVILGVVTEGDKTYCGEISIYERPGGKIPESQKQGPKMYHLRRQAEIDEKQRGIPMPENLRGPFLRENTRGNPPNAGRQIAEQTRSESR